MDLKILGILKFFPIKFLTKVAGCAEVYVLVVFRGSSPAGAVVISLNVVVIVD